MPNGTFMREVWSGSEGYNDRQRVWNQSLNYQREDVLPHDAISKGNGDLRSGLPLQSVHGPDGRCDQRQLLQHADDLLAVDAPVGCSNAPGAPAHGWAWEDLNLRPHPYQGCALTA